LVSDGCVTPIPNPISLQQATRKTAVAIDQRPVAEEVVRRLGVRTTPDKLLKNLTAELDPGTLLIRLTYTDTDPARAKRVVNTFAKVASERIGDNRVVATLWESAKMPVTPVSPNPIRNGLIALAIGLVLSMVVIAIREYLRDNYR
jgi:capsular polysaccharide biosynthesis protein